MVQKNKWFVVRECVRVGQRIDTGRGGCNFVFISTELGEDFNKEMAVRDVRGKTWRIEWMVRGKG